MLQARAEMKNNKAQDQKGIVAEMVKLIPFDSCIHINDTFMHMYTRDEGGEVASWRVTDFTAIPKEDKVEELADYRWIAKQAHFRQWYNRTWRDRYRQQRFSAVRTFGFSKGFRTGDVTGMVRAALQKASAWGYGIVVVELDILTAFDQMIHEALDDAN